MNHFSAPITLGCLVLLLDMHNGLQLFGHHIESAHEFIAVKFQGGVAINSLDYFLISGFIARTLGFIRFISIVIVIAPRLFLLTRSRFFGNCIRGIACIVAWETFRIRHKLIIICRNDARMLTVSRALSLATGGPHPSGQSASYNLKPFNYSAVALLTQL
jgi:hypothetical protein